jgi:hypothetical protein
MDNQQKSRPLDGSTSGTIGGGGPETGGPSDRQGGGDPAAKPENAASGRLAPDDVSATQEPDPPGRGATDVSAVRDSMSSARD